MSRSLEEMAEELDSLYKQKHALEQKERVINSGETSDPSDPERQNFC